MKCRLCGKELTKNEGIAVKHGKVNWYYCCIEHAKYKSHEDMFYEYFNEIAPVKYFSIVKKTFTKLAEKYGWNKILLYTKDNYDYLKKIAMRDFSSEYGMIKYFSKVYESNLEKYKEQVESNVKKTSENEVVEMKKKDSKKSKNRRRGLYEV